MKTPDQLISEWESRPPQPNMTDAEFRTILRDSLKEFQDKARGHGWRQGMSDAAEIVVQTRMRFPMSSVEIVEAQKAILNTRDDKK